MKILQINNCHYRRGGADVVYLNTSQLLLKNGQEVINFSQRTPNDIKFDSKEYFIGQIDFLKLSPLEKLLKTPRFFYSYEAKQKIEFLIKKETPDIAHIHTYKGTLTPSILLPLWSHKIPIVITLHDYGLLCPHNSFLNGRRQICEQCIETGNYLYCIKNRCNRNNLFMSCISSLEFICHKRLFPFSKYFDQLIAVSKFGLEIHRRNKEYSNKISHLYNFFPNLEQTFTNKRKGNYFLFYGRLSKEKGILTLLKAWKNIKVNSVLKIAGDGPLMLEILCFIKENGLSNIDLLGFTKGEELNTLINNASFIIVPSEWYENNPLTIIEAYSNGKPVIASRIGGIPEIVIDRKTGYIFEMKNVDQLTQCLVNAINISNEEYSILSQNAREFAEQNFSEGKHYEKLMNIYNGLVKNGI